MGIIWLASYPKSGNTWLRLYLANLFANPTQPFDINALPGFTFGEHRGDFYERVAGRRLSTLSDEEINRLRPRVHRMLARSRPETLFVKTHAAIDVLDNVPTITPDVTEGGIYVVRNPLDVAVSYAHHLSVPLDEAVSHMGIATNRLATVDQFAFQWLGTWSGHASSWLNAPGLRLHVMRYEDMLAKPEQAFGALNAFLGLNPGRERLRKAIRFASFDTVARQERQRGFIERSKVTDRFFRRGKVGAWRDELSEAQVSKLIADHREVMRRVDYIDDDDQLRI